MNTNLHTIHSRSKQLREALHLVIQTKFEWLHPPRRFVVIKKFQDKTLDGLAAQLISWLMDKDYEVYVEHHVFHENFLEDIRLNSCPADPFSSLSQTAECTKGRLLPLSEHTTSTELLELKD